MRQQNAKKINSTEEEVSQISYRPSLRKDSSLKDVREYYNSTVKDNEMKLRALLKTKQAVFGNLSYELISCSSINNPVGIEPL